MKTLFNRSTPIFLCMLMAGCVNQADVKAGKSVPVASPVVQTETPSSMVTTCPAHRPEICTREYRPVCATLESNASPVRQKTYATGCTACADPSVVSYIDGACPK